MVLLKIMTSISQGGICFLVSWRVQFTHMISGIFRDPQQWDPLGPILFPNPTPIFESLKIWEWYGKLTIRGSHQL